MADAGASLSRLWWPWLSKCEATRNVDPPLPADGNACAGSLWVVKGHEGGPRCISRVHACWGCGCSVGQEDCSMAQLNVVLQ